MPRHGKTFASAFTYPIVRTVTSVLVIASRAFTSCGCVSPLAASMIELQDMRITRHAGCQRDLDDRLKVLQIDTAGRPQHEVMLGAGLAMYWYSSCTSASPIGKYFDGAAACVQQGDGGFTGTMPSGAAALNGPVEIFTQPTRPVGDTVAPLTTLSFWLSSATVAGADAG